MGFFDKVKGMMNPEDDYDDDDYGTDSRDDFDSDYEPLNSNMFSQNNSAPKQPQNNPNPKPQHSASASQAKSPLDLKAVRPEKYDTETVQQLADYVISGHTVILNLESTNKDSARRLIDFLGGVAYSINGCIQRVATNLFIVAPNNVSISGEKIQEAKKQESDSDLF